jgi:hypothetical protein
MVETIIGGAILAALGGFAFLAYNHSHSYARLFGIIVCVPWVATIALLIWFGASNETYITLLPFMRPADMDSALHVLDPSRHALFWALTGTVAFSIYAGFLRALPDLGAVNRDGNDHSTKKQ